MSQSCACCRRPLEAGMACTRCRERAYLMLNEILEFVALAEGELLPGRGSGGRSSGRSLGLRLDALDVVAGLDVLPRLGFWERDWREQRDYSRQPELARNDGLPHARATLSSVVGFLTAHLAWAYSEHPAVDEFHGDLKQLHAQARHAARVEAARVHVVTCPTDTDGGRCGHDLVLRSPELDDHIRCSECATTWTVRRLLLVAASDSDAEVWLPEADVALVHGVATSTLRKWAKADRVRRKRGLYELGSVRLEVAVALAEGRLGHAG